MCTNRIDVPNNEEDYPILKERYLGSFSGGTKNRYNLIKFDRVKEWSVENFDVSPFSCAQKPNSMSDVARHRALDVG